MRLPWNTYIFYFRNPLGNLNTYIFYFHNPLGNLNTYIFTPCYLSFK